ncbi:MAG TPA: hypothetical protein VEW46_23320 [Pyrinomonadaceae bacterium]|nr:hypothetical protein [Pyrinomonadaceae bacterium]
MGSQDIEQLLESAKYKHLSDATLVSYRDSDLDEIAVALADAHLRLCLVCDRRLTFLREEETALTITEQPEINPRDYFHTEIQRLAFYFNDLLTAWIVPFSKTAMRGAGDGDEVWRYESEDGLLRGWAILESDASLTVHFSSPELVWEGARIRFRLGPFSKEVTLQREGESGVAAKIKIPRRERAKKMADISIEVV